VVSPVKQLEATGWIIPPHRAIIHRAPAVVDIFTQHPDPKFCLQNRTQVARSSIRFSDRTLDLFDFSTCRLIHGCTNTSSSPILFSASKSSKHLMRSSASWVTWPGNLRPLPLKLAIFFCVFSRFGSAVSKRINLLESSTPGALR
jgi:hypothetical protein